MVFRTRVRSLVLKLGKREFSCMADFPSPTFCSNGERFGPLSSLASPLLTGRPLLPQRLPPNTFITIIVLIFIISFHFLLLLLFSHVIIRTYSHTTYPWCSVYVTHLCIISFLFLLFISHFIIKTYSHAYLSDPSYRSFSPFVYEFSTLPLLFFSHPRHN